MINRAAIILKYKDPAILWINEVDPYDDVPSISLEEANVDRTVYLISDADADTPDTVEQWIKLYHITIFETELEGWYTDPSLGPKKLTLTMFNEWFEVECHTVLIDTVGEPIRDDDF